jgi:hypothetical protein
LRICQDLFSLLSVARFALPPSLPKKLFFFLLFQFVLTQHADDDATLLVPPPIKSQFIYYDDLIHITSISTSLLCRQSIVGFPVCAASSVVDGSTQKIILATAASNLGLGQ